MAWTSLPPALRAVAAERVLALRQVSTSRDVRPGRASALWDHGYFSSRLQTTRGNATVTNRELKDAQPNVRPPKQHDLNMQHLTESDVQNDQLRSLVQTIYDQASNTPLDQGTRRALRIEVRAATRKGLNRAVSSLQNILDDKRFKLGRDTVPQGLAGLPTPMKPGEGLLLPSAEQYPSAPEQLFNPESVAAGLQLLCVRARRRLEVDESYKATAVGSSTSHECRLEVRVPNLPNASYVLEGSSKKTAKRVAYLSLLSDWHQRGVLRELLDACPTQAGSHLRDVEYLKQHLAQPTKDEYPFAPMMLFEPKQISNAINSASSKLGMAIQVDVDFTTSGLPHEPDFACTLKLTIPGILEQTADGEGKSKQDAKQAAWLHMTSKLHEAGTLHKLFPDPHSAPEYQSEDGIVLEPSVLDKSTLAEEREATIEIYNYAASFGCVPTFETRLIQARSVRVRSKKHSSSGKILIVVKIALPEQNINVSGSGLDLRTAEAAAALAFKAKAEGGQQSHAVKPSTILSTDTARYFFDYLRETRRSLRVEVERERVAQAGLKRHVTRVTVDGKPRGQGVILDSKKQAEVVALLTAALDIAKEDSGLLYGFESRLRQDKGKILRPVSRIPLEIDARAEYIMRTALVQVRSAGLPDSREVLRPEERAIEDTRRRRRRQLSPYEVASLNSSLAEKLKAFRADPMLEELHAKKAALPMNQYREQVLEMIGTNPHSIVIGATGSGKTTQVPQILLEAEIAKGNGGSCNIICTQPRRIAATSVAQRVATERHESLQKSVGYQVRFDNQSPSSRGSITYCTTGVLLEQLKHDPDGILDSASHLILDEVHERDINIDFLMIIVKKALAARKDAGKSVPKVVLMSATLDTDLFANYFAGQKENGVRLPCPSISVPGRTYPVQEKHLEDIMAELTQHPASDLDSILALDNVSEEYLNLETKFSAARRPSDDAIAGTSGIDWKRKNQVQVGREDQPSAVEAREEAFVPTALLAATIAHICESQNDNGAILAFVPGLQEILTTQRLLQQQRIFGLDFGDPAKFKICLLHSSVPKEDQAAVFEQAPTGCRKIILSTNIAETSVTVTDVKYVVDTGKLRETRYDQVRRITKLQCVWEAKSNSKQRAGRAGRVQDGYYYALFSKGRHASLRAVGAPELLRTDLQETLLSIKSQSFEEPVETFLSQAIEPPSVDAIRVAKASLESIEAFTADEKLTDLGRLLSKLPIHPSLGKMIVLGVIFRCLDPLLILGAASEERSLFISPVDAGARRTANSARRGFAGSETSDHLAMLHAFRRVRDCRNAEGVGAAYNLARASFIHFGAFRTIDQTAQQILQILVDSGLIPEQATSGDQYGPPDFNRNANNPVLVRALLLAGLHPNLSVKTSPLGYRTIGEQGVLMHRSSINDDSKRKEELKLGTLFAYSQLSRGHDGASLYQRETSQISPLVAALFGGRLDLISEKRLVMENWLPFFVQASNTHFAAQLVLEFRKALDRVLNVAYRDLAKVGDEGLTPFVDDPIRDPFARKVVELLDHESGRTHTNMFAGQLPVSG